MAAAPDGRLVCELIVQRLLEVSDDHVADATRQARIYYLSVCHRLSGSLFARLCHSCYWFVIKANALVQSEPLQPGKQFKQLQAGIIILAKHAPQFAVDSMEKWRKGKLKDLHDRGLVLTSSKKGLAAVRCSCSAVPIP